MKKVYICDDEIEMLNILHYYLKKDHLVKIFNNPLNLIDFYKEEPCDYVLTDFYMPELNGDDVAKEIKKIKDNAKVILMSGSHLHTNDKQFFDEFIKKPFSKDDILKLIK